MLNNLLQTLAVIPHADLDPGEIALYLAKDEYPELDVRVYLDKIDRLAEDAQFHMSGDLESRTRGLADFLFELHQFHGNSLDYYNPENSYLNRLLDRHQGIPISLSILAMSVGRRAGLRVDGVGLPGHFIVKAVEENVGVLFDPFHGGRLLSPQDCRQLVESVTGKPFSLTAESLASTSLANIFMRVLNNLKSIYAQQEDYPRVIRVLERQRQIDPRDLELRHDLGITLFQNQQYALAIDHLATYLRERPSHQDANTLREMLARARAETARWN